MNFLLMVIAFSFSTAHAGLLEDCIARVTAPMIARGFYPLDASKWRGLDEPALYAGLVTSQRQEFTTTWQLEGAWPEGLEGTYFRMGPFGWDAGVDRKNSVLDSAGGMARRFELNPANPSFANRFIRTPAFQAEQAAGRFLYPTIETAARGSWNSMSRGPNQASVALYPWKDGYVATDDWQRPVFLTRDLETVGEIDLDPANPGAIYLAHAKRDPMNGDLCFLAIMPGLKTKVRAVCFAADGSVRSRREVQLPKLPGVPYFHDWALTEKNVVVYLHPQYISYAGMLKALAGITPLMTALKFDANIPGRLVIVDRESGAVGITEVADPFQVWHFLNAYDVDGETVVDLAATQVDPSAAAGGQSFRLAMVGAEIPDGPPTVSAWRLRVRDGVLTRELLMDDANYEFPQTNPSVQGRPYRYVYLARSTRPTPWHNGVAKWDFVEKRMSVYEFPAHQFVGEPIFAPRRGALAEDDGYLLVDVYDGFEKKSHVAIFDARDLSRGPIARMRLATHMPYGFHGLWLP